MDAWDEDSNFGLDDCIWWNAYSHPRPRHLQSDCSGRMATTDHGVVCETHFNA